MKFKKLRKTKWYLAYHAESDCLMILSAYEWIKHCSELSEVYSSYSKKKCEIKEKEIHDKHKSQLSKTT